jgi:hypothetical protein
LGDGEVAKIKGIVNRRAAQFHSNVPMQKPTDVDDVFRYLQQSAAPFLIQSNERILAAIPAVGLREPRAVRTSAARMVAPASR